MINERIAYMNKFLDSDIEDQVQYSSSSDDDDDIRGAVITEIN